MGGGWLGNDGALDFAGGTVVHINSGVAGLVAAYMLGKRMGLGRESMAPHNLDFNCCRCKPSMGWLVWFQRWFCIRCKRLSRLCFGGDSSCGSGSSNRLVNY